MKQELSVWSLIENNEFEKACKKADEEYSNTGDILALRNKVYALFHLKKDNDIVSLTEKIIEYTKGNTDVDFLNLGIANWILGNSSKAIEEWRQSQYCLYKDAVGGIEIQVFYILQE